MSIERALAYAYLLVGLVVLWKLHPPGKAQTTWAIATLLLWPLDLALFVLCRVVVAYTREDHE